MTATVFYESSSEIALLSNNFLNASQALADPAAVSCVVTDPSGTSTTHTYLGTAPADIVKNSTGKYALSVPCAPAVTGIDGLWTYVWIGTGTVSDIQPGTWRVLPSNVGTWYIGLDEFKDRMGITDSADDSQAQIAIQTVCGWINEWCVVPETPVLTADLRWVPAGDLVVGQELVGVDEEPTVTGHSGAAGWLMTSNRNRFYRRATVLAAPRRMAECVRLVLADGREVTCAMDHRWLVRRLLSSRERQQYGIPSSSRNGGYRWVHARDIVPGDDIASPLRVWPDEAGFKAGWMSGILDGEGWLTGQAAARTSRVGVAQRPGFVLDGIIRYLDDIDVPYNVNKGSTGSLGRGDCVRVEVGARWAAMELLGRLRPLRLMPRASDIWENGRVIREGPNGVRVIATEPAGLREVVSLGTSTGTYLANGLISHNCGEHFNRITETRTFVPRSLYQLNLDPLVSVTAFSLDRDGDGIFEEAWVQNTDYQLRIGPDSYNLNATGILRPYRQAVVIQTGRLFPFVYPFSHFDRVQVTGTWGWSQVPAGVTEAAFILATDLFKFKDAPFGVSGTSDYGIIRIQANPWLIELLRPYANQKRKVGV